MTINGDYATPVTVNGFSCRNCTDVGYAKKHIDPEHPKSGPYGIDAKDDPTLRAAQAVTFSGALSGLNAAGPAAGSQANPLPASGQALDISV